MKDELGGNHKNCLEGTQLENKINHLKKKIKLT